MSELWAPSTLVDGRMIDRLATNSNARCDRPTKLDLVDGMTYAANSAIVEESRFHQHEVDGEPAAQVKKGGRLVAF
jgi:hypothetical protein